MVEGTMGASWAGFIFPDLAYHSDVLMCPEDDRDREFSPPRFTKRGWGNIEWDFFNMDNSKGSFEGTPPPWETADFADYYAKGKMPTMWKLNEADYRTFIEKSGQGWANGVMRRNSKLMPKYTPGPNPDQYWIVFEDAGNVWTDPGKGGLDYRDYAVHVKELGPDTYDISFSEFSGSAANHGVMTDHGMDMWLKEGSGDEGPVGPFYFSDPPTNYGMNTSQIQQGVRQVLFLDYEILLCDPLAEPDSPQAFDTNVAARHLDKTNVVFADGSVQAMSLAKFSPDEADNFSTYWDLAP